MCKLEATTHLLDDAVKELAAADVVQDEIELVGSVKAFLHANDVSIRYEQ